MPISAFAQFLNQWLAADDPETWHPPHWIAEEEQAVLVDLDTGRVLASVMGRCGQYDVSLFVSPSRAVRLSRSHLRFNVAPLVQGAFPRLEIAFEFPADSLQSAQRAVAAILAASN